jgi:putative ABC transport system permease protein
VNPWQTTRIAVRALLRNKLRSFLTMLGIVIGVGAVIAMVAIGQGAKARVEATFASMGSNLLIVIPGSTAAGGMHGGFGSMPSLTWDDLAAIRTEVPTVKAAAPQAQTRAPVVSEDQNWTTQIAGTTPEFFAIRNWTFALGGPFGASDVDSANKVVVLGATVVEKLYGANVDPVGRTVRIKNVPFTIIGVLAPKGQSPMGQDYDDTVVIPVTTFMSKVQGSLQKYVPGAILVSATSTDATRRAEQQITALLRDRHRIPQGGDDDFGVRNLAEIASAQQQGAQVMSTLLAGIAAVSLLVGGIGIMNIMLVSVTERTREIGIRMAVGARPLQILSQFLVESLALSLAGGAVGIGLGLFAAQRLSAQLGAPLLVSPDVIALAVGFSAAVGVVFGLYPARKAARLDPIEALRYE